MQTTGPSRGRYRRRLASLALVLSACAPGAQLDSPLATPPRLRATSTAEVLIFIGGLPPQEAASAPAGAALASTPENVEETDGLVGTANNYYYEISDDPEGSMADALTTLRDFVNPNGPYRDAWWFANDGKADIYELLAVIFYTEGNTNADVLKAVAARYLWYCGGTGTACSGPPLVNFLSYFQPWREPWMTRGRLTQPQARAYLILAEDLVHQRPGTITTWIPGADTFVRNPDSLKIGSSIDWGNTPFHFANVDPSWDSYLRDKLGRGPNGVNRLWVLTMNEARRVCASPFVCENMTRARNP